MSQVYNVPVVLPDLRKEESIRQVIDSLEYIEAVANDIFNRISHRVGENRDQLIAINNRINLAQAKIDKIRNSSTKATKVFAPPKYPAPNKLENYQTVFYDPHPRLRKRRKNKSAVNSRIQEVTPDIISSKSKKPLDIKVATSRLKMREGVILDDADQLGEGLGSLPRHLVSISSLLLFNTSENPYRKYVLMDPLSGVKIKTRDRIIEADNELHEAPQSILFWEELERGPRDSNIYQPKMLDLPELEVPASLPFLSHIADDELFEADMGPSIAPSLANQSIPELPELAEPLAPPISSDAPPPPPPPQGQLLL
jgi:WAS family protein 1